MKWGFVGIFFISSVAVANTCSYTTYQWNTKTRKAENYQRVVKPRSDLTASEVDSATGCSVCEEDQIELRFSGLPPFKLCKYLAAKATHIVEHLQRRNAVLLDVVGYRVGMTRGAIDANGLRTEFSNHSFGVALDINTEQNGLYDNCLSFGPSCRLIKGGAWSAKDPRSLTADSDVVRVFKENGFLWGGEIAGKQKDFMHFSPSGY